MSDNRYPTMVSRPRDTVEPSARLLRAWHLGLLRLALTGDNADRLCVLAIADEIDRLGRPRANEAGFSYFRRTSLALSAAMLRQQDGDNGILQRYLTQIDDLRLRHAFAATLDVPQQKPPIRSRPKPTIDLWRGLPSRSTRQSRI
jgi:hypothetical protein